MLILQADEKKNKEVCIYISRAKQIFDEIARYLQSLFINHFG